MAVEYEDCLKNGIELHGKTFPPLIVLMCFCRTKLDSFGGTSERFFNLSAVILSIPSSIKFKGMFDTTCFNVLSRNIESRDWLLIRMLPPLVFNQV